MSEQKEFITAKISKELHYWLKQRSLIFEGQCDDFSGQIEQILSDYRTFLEESCPSGKLIHMGRKPTQTQELLLQACLESLMILRSKFLPDGEQQKELSSEVKKLICKKLDLEFTE